MSKANRYCTEHIRSPQSNCISNAIIATNWGTITYNLHPAHASYYSNCHLTTKASISNNNATDIFSVQNSVDELQHILLNPPNKQIKMLTYFRIDIWTQQLHVLYFSYDRALEVATLIFQINSASRASPTTFCESSSTALAASYHGI